MHFHKLIKSLQALDSLQIKSLDKYVRSPYFGVYMPSVLLFEHMASLHPRFPNRKITFEAVAELSESLNTLKRQETAATRLMRSIENFIAQEEWQKKEGEVNRYRMRGYKALGLETEFDKAFDKEMKRLSEDTEQDIEVFSERHLLTEMSFNGIKARLVRGPSNNLMPVVITLDEFYAIKKIRYLCEVVNRRQLSNDSYHSQQIIMLREILNPYNSPTYPYVYLFLNAYQMLQAKNYEDSLLSYDCIKKMAEQNNGSTVSQSLREAMGYAVNSTLHWFNMGNEIAGAEYLWWMDWRMKNNLLLDKGKLLPVTFRNMMVLSVGNQDPKWIKETISFYGSYLPDEYQSTYLAFAKGLYHYASKSYKEASRFFLLAQAKEEVVLNCIVRRWQWMCSYECDSGDTDFLLNQITSYEKYLLRNKREIQHILTVFEFFIDGAKRLLNAATSADFNKELEFIQNQPYFTGKKWLILQFSQKKIGAAKLVSGPDFK